MGLTKFEGVTFNNIASPYYVQQLIRALKFRSVGSSTTADRVISFTVTDDSTGTSDTLTKTVDVS